MEEKYKRPNDPRSASKWNLMAVFARFSSFFDWNTTCNLHVSKNGAVKRYV